LKNVNKLSICLSLLHTLFMQATNASAQSFKAGAYVGPSMGLSFNSTKTEGKISDSSWYLSEDKCQGKSSKTGGTLSLVGGYLFDVLKTSFWGIEGNLSFSLGGEVSSKGAWGANTIFPSEWTIDCQEKFGFQLLGFYGWDLDGWTVSVKTGIALSQVALKYSEPDHSGTVKSVKKNTLGIGLPLGISAGLPVNDTLTLSFAYGYTLPLKKPSFSAHNPASSSHNPASPLHNPHTINVKAMPHKHNLTLSCTWSL